MNSCRPCPLMVMAEKFMVAVFCVDGGAVTPASRHSCPNLALSIFLNFKILSVSDFHFKFSFQIIVKYILISKFNLKLR